jgi:hypothetical protein
MSDLSLSNDFDQLLGQPENWSLAQENFDDILAWANGNIGDDNFLASAGMYASYRTLYVVTSTVPGGSTAGDYLLADTARLEGTSAVSPHMYFDDADYAISGRTAKLRLRAQAYTNATAPTISYTVGLFPATAVAGGAGSLNTTLGTVVTGSTVAFTTPSASSMNQGNSGDFSLPADGHYALGVTLSGTSAANNVTIIAVQLQLRWV